jgi:hypothetical protein
MHARCGVQILALVFYLAPLPIMVILSVARYGIDRHASFVYRLCLFQAPQAFRVAEFL